MKLGFVINYRLDSPLNPNTRVAELIIPTPKVADHPDKDEYLLYFCGKIAKLCHTCRFYKNAQVMTPFLERPIRIKYMVALPNDVCILLDASLKTTQIRRKAKESKDYFEMAREHNKSHFLIKHSILLIAEIEANIVARTQLEKEYGIKMMTLDEAASFIEGML